MFHPCRHLAVFGGLASLLALAYGPFVQNLIVIKLEPKNSTDIPTISFVHHFSYMWESGVSGTVAFRLIHVC